MAPLFFMELTAHPECCQANLSVMPGNGNSCLVACTRLGDSMFAPGPSDPLQSKHHPHNGIQRRYFRHACFPFHPSGPMGNNPRQVSGDKITPQNGV